MQKVKTAVLYLGLFIGVLFFSYALLMDNEIVLFLSIGIFIVTSLLVGLIELWEKWKL
jgi:hypothetical protein